MEQPLFHSIIEEICQPSIRASIITSAALIESMLQKLLETYLIPESNNFKSELFDFSGPLGTFSAKNKMAYALRLISKELYQDIDSYRNIRNKCAHKLYLDPQTLKKIECKAHDFKFVKSCFKIHPSEKLNVYTTLECATIIVALIRRINNIEQLQQFNFEVKGDHLGFNDDDFQFVREFTER